jgi:hypothetical protein
MDPKVYAAIMGAVVGGAIAFVGSNLTGLFLYWLEGRRLERQWAREDVLRREDRDRDYLTAGLDEVRVATLRDRGLLKPGSLTSAIRLRR